MWRVKYYGMNEDLASHRKTKPYYLVMDCLVLTKFLRIQTFSFHSKSPFILCFLLPKLFLAMLKVNHAHQYLSRAVQP